MRGNYEQLSRQMMIVSALRTFGELESDELFAKLEYGCNLRDFSYPTERSAKARLLQRDIKMISRIMYIDIEYVAKHGYRIVNSQSDAPLDFDQLFANFDMLTAMQADIKISEYILPEHHRGIGSENLFPILHAIKSHIKLDYDYVFVRKMNNVIHYQDVEPYFLKENQGRWYLIAKHEGILKTFGIDRIKGLIINEHQFKRDNEVNADEMFRNCYGIWDDPNTPIEEIELKYDALDGKFLKTLPLHHSQRVLADTDEEFRISLKLKITNDFVMALLSRSHSLEVIKPAHLKSRIREIAQECANRNK